MNPKTVVAVGGAVALSNIVMIVSILGLKSYIEDTRDAVDRLEEEVQHIQETIITHTPIRIKLSAEEKLCLARNVFFEAGVESYEGKIAVAQVTYNRLKTSRWGDSICDVVYSKAQFSWTLDKKKKWKTPKGKLWDQSLAAVDDFKKGTRIKHLDKSLYYHASYVSPFWKDPAKKIKQIGQHIFYSGAKISI